MMSTRPILSHESLDILLIASMQDWLEGETALTSVELLANCRQVEVIIDGV